MLAHRHCCATAGYRLLMADYSAWIGRTEAATDSLSAAALAGLAAMLDHDLRRWPPGEAPPIIPLAAFAPIRASSEIGADGHLKRGGFLPPIELPRRMWAGSRLMLFVPKS